MTDDELAVAISNQERLASSVTGSDLARERARALDYYLGKPFGNEVEGQSQVVSTDVFEAIEGMLPSLLEIFLASNRLAECEPFGPEDEPEAKQQTEVANHVIMKMNDAAMIFYTWFKDALIQKVGVVKTYYDEEYDESRLSKYQGLTDMEMVKLASDPNNEILSRERRTEQFTDMNGQPFELPVNDLVVRHHNKRGKVCIINIPPENFLISTRQTNLNLSDCEFCSHKERKTQTDLIEMGVEPDFLLDVGDDDSGVETTEEAIARDNLNTIWNRDRDEPDPSMKEYWVSDCYIEIDYDGDGVAELRHVIKVGNKVWLNEETDLVPFSCICPIIIPHQFYGRSIADITADVQETKSALWRQMLNNLYLTNNPRKFVLEGQANMDDLLTSRVGGIVRGRVPGAVTDLVTPFVAGESFPMLEYWDTVKENRSGVTRYNQGTDADSLNKTAHGIQSILGQSMKRLEMVARIFAETGVKDLVRKVLHCIAKSGMKQMVMKLTNGYVSVDPREWKNQYNVTINVGLGTGNKDRTLQMLSMISAKQLELKQTGRGYMVSELNDYNTMVKMIEAAGWRSPELFVTNPQMVPQQAKVPPPNPDMVKLEIDSKLRAQDMMMTNQAKEKDMANDRYMEEMKARFASETDKATALIAAQAQITVAQIREDSAKRMKLADSVMKEQEMQNDLVIKTKPERDITAVSDSVNKSVTDQSQMLVQAIQQANQQTAEALQALAQATERLSQIMLAPRKRIKDKAGKTVGMEVQGFGKVPVQ